MTRRYAKRAPDILAVALEARRGNVITIETATGEDVVKVEFYVDDVLKATVNREPYSWTWLKEIGFLHKHTIKVVGYDSYGNETSNEMTVRKYL